MAASTQAPLDWTKHRNFERVTNNFFSKNFPAKAMRFCVVTNVCLEVNWMANPWPKRREFFAKQENSL